MFLLAHELNNPLNNIGITVETLLDDYDAIDETQKKKLLDDIDTQVERANATVRNLLDFARKDQPVFTSVSIGEVLERSYLEARETTVSSSLASSTNPSVSLALKAWGRSPSGQKATAIQSPFEETVQV